LPHSDVNVPGDYFSLAGFEVTTYGRFWVTPEEEGFAYFLVDNVGRGWILKKFLPEQEFDPAYTRAIKALIPALPGFESGFQRKVLKSSGASSVGFCNREFREWIDGTILMPQVVAPSWAELAEAIRNGAVRLSGSERLLLCRNLSELVAGLEVASLAHRDLSSKNVLLNHKSAQVHFVDWDSLYHASLTMPANTSSGTNGYSAPFVRRKGRKLFYLTWREKADRFALSILNSEFLAIREGSACFEEGGLLRQSDIDHRHGPTLFEMREALNQSFAEALHLFDQAIDASDFVDSPSPSDWIRFALGQLQLLNDS
jgi:serine/threonine protein kinase